MKGVLDMCLLATIIDEPTYGYAMVRSLNDQGLPVASESSIYPALKRLREHELIDAELVPSPSGPARKYYQATDRGRAVLAEWIDDWRDVQSGVDAVIDGR
jgi:PadR family transcriptional regulator PadR